MANQYFKFKQFEIQQEKAPFKVGTDGVLIGAWAELENTSRILDIGTGTGLIAIMAAQRSKAKIDALEPNETAFEQAVENCNRSKFRKQLKVHNKSLQEYAPNCNEKYDRIISNPPYFNQSLQNQSRDLTQARHTVTLNYEELLSEVKSLLKPEGAFSVVLPYTEGRIFIGLAEKIGLFPQRICEVLPTPQKQSNRLLIEFSEKKGETEKTTLVIEAAGRHRYSEEYKALTRAFYLKF